MCTHANWSSSVQEYLLISILSAYLLICMWACTILCLLFVRLFMLSDAVSSPIPSCCLIALLVASFWSASPVACWQERWPLVLRRRRYPNVLSEPQRSVAANFLYFYFLVAPVGSEHWPMYSPINSREETTSRKVRGAGQHFWTLVRRHKKKWSLVS